VTIESRILVADALRRAPCPTCKRLCTADPSLRIPLTCRCGLRLMPKRIIGGIAFVELTPRGAA
jgi:hypothetical protein